MKKDTGNMSESSKTGVKVSRKSMSQSTENNPTIQNSKKQIIETAAVLSLEETVWDEIKDIEVDMFGLPNQLLHMHVIVKASNKDSCILLLKSDPVVISLEERVGDKFHITSSPSYVTVSRKKSHD